MPTSGLGRLSIRVQTTYHRVSVRRLLWWMFVGLVFGSCSAAPEESETQPAICRAPSHCPGEDSECTVRTCVDGFCGIERRDGPLDEQTDGDCLTRICERGEVALVLEYDPFDDDNPCTSDECIDGQPVQRPLSEDYRCGAGSATHCDGEGNCVGCASDADCPADTACADWSCVDTACVLDAAPAGLPCGAPRSCGDGLVMRADVCDGEGACQPGGTEGCSGYACADDGTSTCRTTCLEDEECAAGYTCLVPSLQGYGECVPR